MSRLESEPDCSTELCAAQPSVAQSYGCLPETLASVACGLDLGAGDPSVVVPAVEAIASPLPKPAVVDPPIAATPTKRSSRIAPSSQGFAKPMKAHRSSRIWELMRSRRVRALLTLVGVLMIAGLVGLNLRSGQNSSNGDDTELELSEFGNDKSFAPGTVEGSNQVPGAFDNGGSAEPHSGTGQNQWAGEAPRLPPLGLAPLHDAEVIPAGRMEPSSASGPRGAWLTGQIEVEPSGVVPVSGSWSSANGSNRANQTARYDSFPQLR